MVIDGWVLPDREAFYNRNFDLNECFYGFKSFLRNYSFNDTSFDLVLLDSCKKHNVNVRVILAMLQMGGLLSRKQAPQDWVIRSSILLPYQIPHEENIEERLRKSIQGFRILFDGANLTDPLQVKDGAVLPKSRLSFVLFSYICEIGTRDYPDAGMFKYLRLYNQLGRFLRPSGDIGRRQIL